MRAGEKMPLGYPEKKLKSGEFFNFFLEMTIEEPRNIHMR
jgi:hypothetical protein